MVKQVKEKFEKLDMLKITINSKNSFYVEKEM